MIHRIFHIILATIGFALALHAQEKEAAVPLQFRAVLHAPLNPVADLFFMDQTGAIVPLHFRPQDLSEKLLTLPVNGSLVFYDKAVIDPENPAASLAASVAIPADLKQAIIVVMPSPAGKTPAYRLLLIDDSVKAFPNGHSKVLSLIGTEAAIQAGEHKLPVHPGKIASVPPVKNVNNFNMAQTNFYYQKEEQWVVFAERQLQFIDACRRLFIIHATPGALQPTITTIVDTSVRAAAR